MCANKYLIIKPCKVIASTFDGFKPNTLYKINNYGEIVGEIVVNDKNN